MSFKDDADAFVVEEWIQAPGDTQRMPWGGSVMHIND
jgi:hypothetical protein